MLLGLVMSAGADNSDSQGQVALETTPIGAKTAPLLIDAAQTLSAARGLKAVPHRPSVSTSEQLGDELSKMFQEGAAKLDAPRPKQSAEQALTAGGAPEGGRSISVMAYSYCLNGRTASGRYTAPGIVAVDTRVIPMGSKLYIPGYGWGVAADTGGAIQGAKIDVWFPSLGQCYQWGVRPVTIKVFPK